MSKKFYWLKLKEDFFKDKEMKKLRKIAGGDTYTIIYLKMMLLGLRDEGKLFFEGIEDSFAEEIALELDEEVENVKITLMYMIKTGLLEEVSETEMFLTRLPECVGKETSKAELMRKKRARDKTEKLENGNNVTQALPPVTFCYTEKEKEKELEKEKKNFMPVASDEQSKPPSVHEQIFDHYISKGLIKHKTLTAAMKTAINARLKDYSYEELVQAIDNYTIVYNGREYYFKQKYGLADLMRDKDVRKFIDEADPLNNFLTNKRGARTNATYQQSGTSREQGKRNNFESQYGVSLDF